MQTSDVIVIGGGIAGISLAGRLAGRARVTVLEREPVLAYHTTGRSAAMFTRGLWQRPRPRLDPGIAALLREPAAGLQRCPAAAIRASCFPSPSRTRKPSLAERIAENPGIIAPLAPAGAHALMPLLREGRFSRFSIERSSADIDVGALFDGFRRMALRGGAEILTGREVAAIEADVSGWTVRTVSGVFSAPILVNAAGAWGGRIGVLAGLGDKGLQPLRRTAVMIAAPEGVDVSGWPHRHGDGRAVLFQAGRGPDSRLPRRRNSVRSLRRAGPRRSTSPPLPIASKRRRRLRCAGFRAAGRAYAPSRPTARRYSPSTTRRRASSG